MPSQTTREELASFLESAPYSAKQLAVLLRMKISDTIHHLEHIQRSYGKAFVIDPAYCNACEFTFNKRSKLSCPSKCPECRNQRVDGPWLSIEP